MELTVPPRLTLPRDCDEAARGRLALTDAVKILVVEDDQLIRAMVEEALSDGGFASHPDGVWRGSHYSFAGRTTNPNSGRS
ncbi:hypothetical protein ABH972_007737 [Bradyrhizobium ottawaense]|uniref:hypothetical protein n=1 Tax=Bradyrhizobium ottawaense TaxID=931866 RepID=UPI00339AD200